jgi:hypothetical protein
MNKTLWSTNENTAIHVHIINCCLQLLSADVVEIKVEGSVLFQSFGDGGGLVVECHISADGAQELDLRIAARRSDDLEAK